jgi:hypothetical protein
MTSSLIGDGSDERETFWSENLKGRDHWEDLDVDDKIII